MMVPCVVSVLDWFWFGVMVLRVGDAWLIGVGKRAPHEFRCLWLVSPHGSLDRLKAYALFPLH